MTPRLRYAWLLLLACVYACGEPEDVAQTVLWIDAATTVRAAIARISVQAEGPTGELEPAIEQKDPEWPIKLVLAPKHGDASRSFTLHIALYDAQASRLSTIRFASGFVAHQSRYAKLYIHDGCVQTPASCDDCNSYLLELPGSALSRKAEQPRTLDALCEGPGTLPPAVTNAGSSGSVNAGQGAAGAGATSGNGGTPAAGSGGQPGACGPGYVQSATGCVDIDDCVSNPCGAHGRCQNTPGNYVCECESGYLNQSGTCVSPGACQTNNGGCETNCQMTPTGAACSCAADEWLKGDRKSCAGFGPAERLSRTGSTTPTQPAFAFDGEGNGLAVWTQNDGMNTTLWTRRYVAASGWAANAAKLSIDADGTPSAPRVALGPNGRGAIVWVQTASGDGDVWGVRYENPSFGKPARIDEEGMGSNALDPSVVLDGAGNGFAAWTQSDGSSTQIWVNRLSATGGWGKPTAVKTTGDEQAFGARLAIDPEGNANLAWTQTNFEGWSQSSSGWTEWMNGGSPAAARYAPWTSRFELKMDRWHSPTELDDTGSAGFPDNQVFGLEANRVAVWPRMSGGSFTVRASTFSTKAGWSDSVAIGLGTTQFTAVLPRVALAPSGDGAAIWAELHDSTSSIWANRYRGATAEWLGPTELSSFDSATSPAGQQLAVEPNGDGFGIWSEIRGTARTIKVARLQADVGFLPSHTLATDTASESAQNSPAQIAVDSQGNALAMWDVMERGLFFPSASAFK